MPDSRGSGPLDPRPKWGREMLREQVESRAHKAAPRDWNRRGHGTEGDASMHDQPTAAVPYGYCHCGCGQQTNRASQNSTRHGWVRGEPIRFITGHNTRVVQPASAPPRGEGHDYLVQDCGYETPCWVWQRYLNNTGYGRLKRGGRHAGATLAHRWYYEKHLGPVPAGLVLDHLCRNPACVNPDHLEPVTYRENTMRGIVGTRTHCKYGHPFEGDNLSIVNGTRVCRICNRRRQDEFRARRKAQIGKTR